jgi:hypothetical protein
MTLVTWTFDDVVAGAAQLNFPALRQATFTESRKNDLSQRSDFGVRAAFRHTLREIASNTSTPICVGNPT